jgi:protease I
MKEAGAQVTIIGPQKAVYTGKRCLKVQADKGIEEVKIESFDALIIPGGYSPERMRRSQAMVRFVKEMHDSGKLIAAICHGPWMLASADILRDVHATSFFSIQDDIKNAGANWEDSEVVADKNIITSRMPDDMPAFCRKIIEGLGNE